MSVFDYDGDVISETEWDAADRDELIIDPDDDTSDPLGNLGDDK